MSGRESLGIYTLAVLCAARRSRAHTTHVLGVHSMRLQARDSPVQALGHHQADHLPWGLGWMDGCKPDAGNPT